MLLRISDNLIVNTAHVRSAQRLPDVNGEPRTQLVLFDSSAIALACDFDHFAAASGAAEVPRMPARFGRDETIPRRHAC